MRVQTIVGNADAIEAEKDVAAVHPHSCPLTSL